MNAASTFSRLVERRPGLVALAIITATTLIRLWFVATSQLDLVQDEAQYWDWSRTLQLSYYSKGPLIAYLIGLGTALFGDTTLGVRACAVAGSALLQAGLYLGLARLFHAPRQALWALVIAATMPMVMVSGLLMTTDNPLLVCWTAAMFGLHAAATDLDSSRGSWPYWLMGACLVLGTLAKYMMLAFVPLALMHGLVLWRWGVLPKGYFRRLGRTLLVGAGLGLAPILIWNAANGFVGARHVAHQGGMAGTKAMQLFNVKRFPEYAGSLLGVITPWWTWLMLAGGWLAAVNPGRLGLERRQGLLLALFFWPVWTFFLLWSLHAKVQANWAGVSFSAGIMLAAFAWTEALDRAGSFFARTRRVWLGLGLAMFVAVHGQNWLPLPGSIDLAVRLKGWSDLGEQLVHLRQAGFADPDRVFVFSNSYDMTAALSFYGPDKSRAFSVNTGRRLSQYDLWPGPEDKRGWDALYVLKDSERIEPEVEALFDRVERLEYRTRHEGRPARLFTIYLCHGYSGLWPRPAEVGY